MKTRVVSMLAALAVAMLVVHPALDGVGTASAQSDKGPVPGEILVKFKSDADDDEAREILRQNNLRRKRLLERIDVEVVEVPRGQETRLANALSHNPKVEFAEVNGQYEAVATPNDPSFPQQWGLHNTGGSGGKNDADIDAPQAWDTLSCQSSVKIAILDTGVDRGHEDLELDENNQRDFTGNGVGDRYGHGTHVAGIVAAVRNNSKGVAGVAHGCTIGDYKVLGDNGSGAWSWIANGIRAAADDGYKVINLSLGSTAGSSTVESAINYAWGKGVVIACAAGNNGRSSRFYPAAYTNCIAVAATDRSDRKASFSNHGSSWVDVAAPGVSILSTVKSGGYESWNGTSMATPHVAGLAGLVWSSGVSSASSVRSKIESTTDSLSGTRTYWSKGRINACKAVGGSGC
jgi:thermitase